MLQTKCCVEFSSVTTLHEKQSKFKEFSVIFVVFLCVYQTLLSVSIENALQWTIRRPQRTTTKSSGFPVRVASTKEVPGSFLPKLVS